MRTRQEISDDMTKLMGCLNKNYKQMRELIREADENKYYELTVITKPMLEYNLKKEVNFLGEVNSK